MLLGLSRALAAAVLLTACRAHGSAAPPTPSPFEALAYRKAPISTQTKVFLVAGGDDVANFAAEVLEQRALWQQAGLHDDEIACYYARPTKEAWEADHEQYAAIAESLRDCRAADPAQLQSDLSRVAETDPPWVYLYVSSHGVRSILGLAKGKTKRRLLQQLAPGERAELDTHAIALQGSSPKLSEVSSLVAARRNGAPMSRLALTPQTLGEALLRFPSETEKIVVLQACFSGGFVGHDPAAGDDTKSPLHEVPNLVVLTAAAASRPSFGCGAGSHRTYFGGAYNRSLARALRPDAPPSDLPWREIFERAAFAVEAMEAVDAERPSLPGFYSNAPSQMHICDAPCSQLRSESP